jgi:hypothetical protein
MLRAALPIALGLFLLLGPTFRTDRTGPDPDSDRTAFRTTTAPPPSAPESEGHDDDRGMRQIHRSEARHQDPHARPMGVQLEIEPKRASLQHVEERIDP